MMLEKNNTTCSICGKEYYLCISCKNTKTLSPWKIHTDTAEHYKVYQILHGVSTGVYTKQEAKDKLHNVDLSDLNEFRKDIKKRINDILNDEDKKIEICDGKELTDEKPVVKTKPVRKRVVEIKKDIKKDRE